MRLRFITQQPPLLPLENNSEIVFLFPSHEKFVNV